MGGKGKKKNLVEQIIENQSQAQKRRKSAERLSKQKERPSKKIQSHGANSPRSQRNR